MKLQIKILLSISVIVTCLLLIFGAIVTFIINRSFAQLDYDRSVRNTIRIKETLDQYQETLKEKVADWSTWDEPYNFLKNGNAEFIDANLTPSSFMNLNIQHIIFLNTNKQVQSSWSIDSATGSYATESATQITDVLKLNPLPDFLEDQSISGYLQIPNGIVIYGAHYVNKSDGSGPSAGILLFGQNLDTELVAKISLITKSVVSLERSDMAIPFKEVTIFSSTDRPPDMKSYYFSSNQSLATIPISSYLGEKIGLMYLKTERDSEKLGRANRIFFLLSLGMVGFILCVFVLVLGNILVLKRIRTISKVVQSVAQSNKLDAKISVSGHDELTDLSYDLNHMFESLKAAQAFMATKEELEAKVKERTEELANSKKELEDKLTEVERLNQLMVGRESKMIELKNEIELLKQKISGHS